MPPSSLSPSLESAALPELPPVRSSLGSGSTRPEARRFDRVLSSCDDSSARSPEKALAEKDEETTTEAVPVAAAQQALASLLFVPARPEPLPVRELITDPAQGEEVEGIENVDTEGETDASRVLSIGEDNQDDQPERGRGDPGPLPAVAFSLSSTRNLASAVTAPKPTPESVAKHDAAAVSADVPTSTPTMWKHSLRALAVTPTFGTESVPLGEAPVAASGEGLPPPSTPLATTRYREVTTPAASPLAEASPAPTGEPLPPEAVATAMVTAKWDQRPAPAMSQAVPGQAEEAVVDPLAAKNADAVVSRSAKEGTRGITPFAGKKEKILAVDNKLDAKLAALLGTDVANQGETSMSAHRQTPLEPVSRAAELSVGAGRAEATSETKPGVATQAVRVVEDIREISAGLNAHRRHVELNFDFGDQGRLEVRLDVRHGQIETQFRTDSTEVREALQQAWNSQGLSSEGRARLAEPAFLPAQPRSENASQQSFADAQSRQQRQTAGESSSLPSFSRPAAPVASSSPAVPLPVVASDRQLHAFA